MSVLISQEEFVFAIRKTKYSSNIGGNSIRDTIPKSIQRIEQHRALITKRIIRGTITRMRRFDMNGKVKPKKLKIAEFAILDESERPKGLRVEDPDRWTPERVEDPVERLYRFGGFSSDSD
jgi:hypothetical protein